MADEHNCIACPVEVRGLYATASNALNAWKCKDDPSRVARLMANLEEALSIIAPIVDKHFEGLDLMTGKRTPGSPVSVADQNKYGVIR